MMNHPVCASHFMLGLVSDAVNSINRQLMQYEKDDEPPALSVVHSSISRNNELVVTVEMSLGLKSLKRSVRSLRLNSLPEWIEINSEQVVSANFDLSSGAKHHIEYTFPIVNADALKEKGAIEIGIVYDADVDGSNGVQGKSENRTVKLACQVAAEQQIIDQGSFNPHSNDYRYSAKYNSATKAQFVGREHELKQLKDALYDEAAGRYKINVGMTIAGRRRTGKSWLAGRFCETLEEIKKDRIIICNKVDVGSVDMPGDLEYKIIQSMINADESLKPLAAEAYDELKPSMVLKRLAQRLIDCQRTDLLDHLSIVQTALEQEGVLQGVSVAAFYSALAARYKQKYGCEIPPMLIVLDEFTAVQHKIANGILSRDEVTSIIKLTEMSDYRINVLLICADNFASVKEYLDTNAFLHYKTAVNIDGIQKRETQQMICRKIPVEMPNHERVMRQCMTPDVAEQLHNWFDGNVYLIAAAAEKIVEHMNGNGYTMFEDYQLRWYAPQLLDAMMTKDYLEAYTNDGRFLEDWHAGRVLCWLNIQAMAKVAEEGGRCEREAVLEHLRKEYIKLFETKDSSRLMNVLHDKNDIAAEELPLIRERIVKAISPSDVVSWLVDRGVFREDKEDGKDMIVLPLKAYVEARKNTSALCRRLEVLDDYAADTKLVKAEPDTEPDEEEGIVEDVDFG